mgnify:CR=1 FL=1
MSAAVVPWLEFVICAALIGIAGSVLTRYGEVIARSWIGLVLLATATSLPELLTGVSAVSVADAPNIAVGDALGSCVFNLSMLVLLDELSRKEPLYRSIDQGHLLSAGFCVILIGSAGAFLLLSQNALSFSLLHVSGYTPFIVLLYLVAIRATFAYERRNKAPSVIIASELGITLRMAVIRYLAAATVVVAAGTWLPFIGRDLSNVMGWNATFVGTLFIAAATSIPELAVTISALRLRAVDMAIGNLLGSNLFDILILAVDDIAYTKGPLFSSVAPANAITAFAAVIMSGIFIVAVLYKPETRIGGTIGWTSIALLMVYLFSSYAVYLYGH